MGDNRIVARGSTTLKRVRNAGTVSMNLINLGTSLTQYISGSTPNPDWTQEGSHPIVIPLTRYSRYSDPIFEYNKVDWFYDGQPIADDDARFDKTKTQSYMDHEIPCLIVKANLGLDITSSKLIACVGTVTIDGILNQASADIPVKRQESSESTYIGELTLPADKPAFSSTIDTLPISAQLMKGGDSVSNFTVGWYRLVANDTDGVDDGLEELGKTGNPITISKNEVDLREVIVAKFIVESLGVVDTKMLVIEDLSDPYEMVYEYDTQVDGVLDETNGITTTVKVIHRDSKIVDERFKFFAFELMNGIERINGSKGASNSYKVTKDDFDKAKSDELTLEIEASDREE